MARQERPTVPPPPPDTGWWQQLLPLPEVRIVVTYLILASAWIVASDAFLERWEEADKSVGLLQSVKGLNFVFTTSILLYFVLRRAYGGWRRAEEHRRSVIEKARVRFRDLSARLQTLREEERTRISREIHDDLGQLLTGLKLELRWIEDRLAGRDDRSLNPVIDKLVETTELVDQAIGSVQRIAADLRPSALDNLGLATAIREEGERFAGRTGIACQVEPDEQSEAVPPEVATAAFRIFQESLTNVARHSGARTVRARCEIKDGQLNLAVQDDGKGITADAFENPKSLGLLGMKERAEQLGGQVAVERGSDGGTRIWVKVPLPSAPNVSPAKS
jgi:signal transduction histidine kinase